MVMIDEAIEYLKDFDSYSPYQEVVNKVSSYIEQMQADYEARLRADMMTMLEEIQLEIADNVESIIGHYDASTPERKRPLCKSARNEGRTECIDVIQQKINSLKEAAT